MRPSIIIPTWNEEAYLPTTLENLRRQFTGEIVVADGGSTDRTVSVATLADRVLIGVQGRAAQMNLGARSANGDILIFLHADCLLEDGALDEAVLRLARPGVAAGCFRMCVPQPHWLYRTIAECATARVRLFGIVYGDQGLYLRRELFDRAGGFPHLRFMEDVFLSLKLRRLGRIVVTNKRIFVSPRRWQKTGIVRQTLCNWGLTALAASGIHPDRLARYYPEVR